MRIPDDPEEWILPYALLKAEKLMFMKARTFWWTDLPIKIDISRKCGGGEGNRREGGILKSVKRKEIPDTLLFRRIYYLLCRVS